MADLSPPPDGIRARRGIAEPVVALTFDDGPAPWTDPIVDELERHGGRGTFFVVGDAIDSDERRATLRRLAAGGHDVGNHTFSHPDLQSLTDDEIRAEMSRASRDDRGRARSSSELLARAVLPLRRAGTRRCRRPRRPGGVVLEHAG